MNFFMARCLYSAARIQIRAIKSLAGDLQTVESLQYLITTMTAMKDTNPLMNLFLRHISQDMEGVESPDPPLIP